MNLLAAVDIGSNGVRLLIGAVGNDGKVTTLDNQREAVRLGQDVFLNGDISADSLRRLIEALKKFKRRTDELSIKSCQVVATSALREAKNSSAVIKTAKDEVGWTINTIAGEEEARLIHLAVASVVDLKSKTGLLIDIGGGSVEVSVTEDDNLVICDSFKMGTVRLLQILDEKKRGREKFLSLLQEYTDTLRRQLKKELGKHKINICVGTGGNIEMLGELRAQILGKVRRNFIRESELRRIVETLEKYSYEDRVKQFGLRPDRADVIIPAGRVLLQIFKQIDIQEMHIPNVGLKEGVLIDSAPNSSTLLPETVRRRLLSYAKEIGRRFSYDEEHGLAVSRFAATMFDETRKLHGLDARARVLLEIAGMLHDIGQCINQNGHHKHSYYLLHAVPFVGLSTREREVVALVCRYHRRAHPSLEHEEFATISGEDRDLVTKLSAILRIANALDAEHEARVRELRVDIKGSRCDLQITGRGNLAIEKWAAVQHAGMFEKVFGVSLNVLE